MVKLSIIIPVFNAEKFIANTIKTVTDQKISDYEIIIVDDGSSDSSLEICNRIGEGCDNIHVFSKANEGVSIARNYGISKASGDWITFLDADDGIIPEALESIVRSLDDSKELVFVNYTKNENNKADGSLERYELDPSELRKCILNYTAYSASVKSKGYKIDTFNNWTCWGKFYRRSVIIDNAIAFPAGITHGEDLIFLYHYYCCVKNALYLDQKMYFYRTDNDSVTRRFNPNRIKNTNALFDKLQAKLLEDDIPEFHFFVCNRVFACCYMYFADKDNKSSFSDRKQELEVFCKQEIVTKAIKCRDRKAVMSIGKKTDFFMKAVISLLDAEKFGLAIRLSEVFNI